MSNFAIFFFFSFTGFLQITFNAICKMLISTEEECELEILRNDVSEVTEAMLAFPLKLPGTRFYRGLEVSSWKNEFFLLLEDNDRNYFVNISMIGRCRLGEG